MTFAALVGERISDSLSPVINTAAFRSLGLEWSYALREAGKDGLANLVNWLVREGVAYFNVTTPYKEEIRKYVIPDEISKEIGAVNTVLNKNGKLYGYNTDWIGFTKALQSAITSMQSRRRVSDIVMVGTGGAARAVAYAIKKSRKSLTVLGRNPKKARALARQYGFSYRKLTDLNEMGGDVLINATPADLEIKGVRLGEYGLYFDLRCEKAKTLERARKTGCSVENGLTMLVYQAAESINLMTEKMPDTKIMFMAARDELNRRQSQ